MGSRSSGRARASATSRSQTAEAPHQTTFAPSQGLMVVRDRRMFRRGQEAFCRRLAVEAALQDEVHSVRVCLESNECRIEFSPGRVDEPGMADRFARAVRQAVADPSRERRGTSSGIPWEALTSFPAPEDVSVWEIETEGPERVKAGHPRLRGDAKLARRVADELRQEPGIVACRLGPRKDLEITFDRERLQGPQTVERSEQVLLRILHPEAEEPPAEEAAPRVAAGFRRWYYLAMAGGSFTLTLVALMVPGVPTVPFLLGTSYYLARSSPTLNRALSRSWYLGPIVTDLEDHGGLRPFNKLKLLGLTLGITTVTLLIVGPTLAVLAVVFAAGLVSVSAISKIPGLPTRTRKPAPTSPGLALA